MRKAFLFALSGLVFVGCADPQMEQRVAELENRLAELEKQPAAPAAPDQDAERQAGELLRAANEAANGMKYDEAKKMLAELKEKYSTTRAYRASMRLSSEIEIIGADAGELEIEKWFQGNTTLADGEATLVVFWEEWCPHCRREVPEIEATYNKYKDKGLNVVGLTKITKSSTEDKVTSFIAENKLTYPIAKETGAVSQRFGVRGIPAAAVVQDGKVVWRGHPGRLNDKMLESWIDG